MTTAKYDGSTAGARDFLPLAFDLGAGIEGGGMGVLVLALLAATMRYVPWLEAYKILVEFRFDSWQQTWGYELLLSALVYVS